MRAKRSLGKRRRPQTRTGSGGWFSSRSTTCDAPRQSARPRDDEVEGRPFSRRGVQARPEVLCDRPGGAQAAGVAPAPNGGKQARAPDLGKHRPVGPQKVYRAGSRNRHQVLAEVLEHIRYMMPGAADRVLWSAQATVAPSRLVEDPPLEVGYKDVHWRKLSYTNVINIISIINNSSNVDINVNNINNIMLKDEGEYLSTRISSLGPFQMQRSQCDLCILGGSWGISPTLLMLTTIRLTFNVLTIICLIRIVSIRTYVILYISLSRSILYLAPIRQML